MKDTLLNTFDPKMTFIISMMLIMGALTWTNKITIKPSLPNKPTLKLNKFL